jgi:ureidoacrylate peracid hydrolase
MCLGNTMIDALWRNYRVLLLRDCTYAIEIPGIDEPGAWTNRWILYAECAIGYTTTSDAWIAACRAAREDKA